MNTPRQESNWRPQSEISGRFELDSRLMPAEVYQPRSQQDAYDYVGELALQSVMDYAGHPAVQSDIIQSEARRMFPSLFNLDSSSTPALTNDVIERHRQTNGQINWNAVAKVTSYVASVTKLTD